MPEAIGAEAFGDEEELARVSEFLSTVAGIEELTGLNFGEAVRQADIRDGLESAGAPALTLDPTELNDPRPKPKKKGRKAVGRRGGTRRTR